MTREMTGLLNDFLFLFFMDFWFGLGMAFVNILTIYVCIVNAYFLLFPPFLSCCLVV